MLAGLACQFGGRNKQEEEDDDVNFKTIQVANVARA